MSIRLARVEPWDDSRPGVRRRRLVRAPEGNLWLYRVAPSTLFPPHSHPYAQLGIVLDGGGLHRVGGTMRRLYAWDGVSDPAHTEHEFESNAKGTTVILDVELSPHARTPSTDDGTARPRLEPIPGPTRAGRTDRSEGDWTRVSPGVEQRAVQRHDGSAIFAVVLAAGCVLPPHPHDVARMGLLVEGGGTHVVGAERRRARAGDSYYVPAGLPHGFEADRTMPTTSVEVAVPPARRPRTTAEFSPEPMAVLRADSPRRVAPDRMAQPLRPT